MLRCRKGDSLFLYPCSGSEASRVSHHARVKIYSRLGPLEVLATKPGDLSWIPGIHVVKGEPAPACCPLASPYVTHSNACACIEINVTEVFLKDPLYAISTEFLFT